MQEKVEARIVELKKQREELLAQANAMLERLNGAIAELEHWLEEEDEQEGG